MARKPPPRGPRSAAGEANPRRHAPPPPAGLPVLPRPLQIDEIRDDGKSIVSVEATEAERMALAEAYAIQSIGALSGRYSLVKRGKSILVTGTVKASITQICVMTLEPFETLIEDPVDMEFAPEALVAEAWERIAKAEASGTNAPLEDPPDAIVEGRIDLGALTAEALALALDPYPKKPGVAFDAPDEPAASEGDSPFAVLARLKGQGGST